MRDAQEKLKQEQETLAHYKNYSFGNRAGEDQELRQLVQNKEREIERQMQEIGAQQVDMRSRQNVGFQGDMNELARQANQNKTIGVQIERQNFSQRQPTDLFSEDFLKNIRGAGLIGNTSFEMGTNQMMPQMPGSNRNNENLNIINSIFGNVPQVGGQVPIVSGVTPIIA